MYINTFQYTAEDVDCKLCTMYAGKRRGCRAQSCPWLAERIEAGVVGYEEAIMETFPRSPHLDEKLHTVIRRFTGSLFLSPGHRQRMETMKIRMGYSRRRDRPAYFAAMKTSTTAPPAASAAGGSNLEARSWRRSLPTTTPCFPPHGTSTPTLPA